MTFTFFNYRYLYWGTEKVPYFKHLVWSSERHLTHPVWGLQLKATKVHLCAWQRDCAWESTRECNTFWDWTPQQNMADTSWVARNKGQRCHLAAGARLHSDQELGV